MKKRDAINHILTHTTEEVIVRSSLEKALRGRKKLRIKFGADPTSPDLHLGNAVPLWKLREFQNLGHTIVFIIGDATARIGDPSGRIKARPILSDREIQANMRKWLKQIKKIVDVNLVEIRYNSEWYDHMTLPEIMQLASHVTVARIIERDDFANRIKSGIEVHLQEIFYPLMQAYDSIMVKADVEIGGTDQLFNLLTGRELQKKLGERPQDIMTLPLLVGLDGKEKMSKSIGNTIEIMDTPEDMFGKVMSVPDEVIMDYAQLAAQWDNKKIKETRTRLKQENPRDVKADVAEAIVCMYFPSRRASQARKEFERVFRSGELPQDIKETSMRKGSYNLVTLLTKTKLASSRSDARRLIVQGAVRVDGVRQEQQDNSVRIDKGTIIQVGKRRFVRII